jgi:hypothetical protein
MRYLKYLSLFLPSQIGLDFVRSYGRNVRVDGYIGITNIGGATCYLLSILQQVSFFFFYDLFLSHIL